jgi:hypothetical protein
MKFEYGAMSSKFSIEADNKLTAYAGMIIHFGPQAASMIALYEPEECQQDSWLFASPIDKRLDEIYGGEGTFYKYLNEHKDEIKAALETIEKLI